MKKKDYSSKFKSHRSKKKNPHAYAKKESYQRFAPQN